MKSLLSILLLLVTQLLLAQQPKLVLPIGHRGLVNSAAFSPDNKLIVTASEDGTAKIWQVPTGRVLADLKGYGKGVNSVIFSPDGKSIFTSADSVRMYVTASGNLMYAVKGRFSDFAEMVLTPDSKTFITADDDSVYLWQVVNGQPVSALKIAGEKYLFRGVNACFNATGDRFIVGAKDEMAHVYSTTDLSEKIVLKGHNNSVITATFSRNNKYILTTSEDKSVKLWDANTGKLLNTLITYEANSKTAVFSKNAKYIVTLSRAYGDSARIWNSETGRLVCCIKGDYQNFELNSGIFNADETKIILKSEHYNESIVVNLPEGKIINSLIFHKSYVNFASFSADDKYIVTTSQDKTAGIWNSSNGTLVTALKGKSEGENEKGYFSPDKKYFVISTGDKKSIWNTADGSMVTSFAMEADIIEYVSFSPDSRFLVTITNTNKVRTWDVITKQLLVTNLCSTIDFFSSSYKGVYQFTEDSKKFCVGTTDRGAFIFDPVNGKMLTAIYDRETLRSDFSQDGKFVAIQVKDTMKIWDGITGALINRIYIGKIVDSVVFIGNGKLMVFDYEGTIYFFNTNEKKAFKTISNCFFSCFNAEKTKVVTTHNNGTINIWDLKNPTSPFVWNDEVSAVSNTRIGFKCILNGNLLLYVARVGSYYSLKVFNTETKQVVADLTKNKGNPLDAHFSADNKYVLVSFSDGRIRIWRVDDSKMIREFIGHSGWVNQVSFLTDEKRVISMSSDNMAKVWDTDSEKELYSFFGIDGKDYLTIVPSGYYMSSRNAAKTLYYVTPDLKVVTFEQLDLKYNRPDMVLKLAEHPDQNIIEAYYKAYLKRIRKMNMDTSSFKEEFNAPQMEFLNRNEIEYNQKYRQLKLHILGNDSNFLLDRFNVWINEVPLFGLSAKSIRKRNANSLDTTVIINLSNGENSIETSIINANGTESYRMPLLVNYTPTLTQKEKTYFIGIGINQFAENKYNLQYSVKDIRDLSNNLKEKFGNDIVIDTLFNENVTVNNVKALKKKLLQTTENDKVIIAYSGHGMLSKDYDYYLSTYSVNFENPEHNGLPYDELENLLDSIPARKKLLLIDACHSGEVDKEELEKIKNFETDTTKTNGAKGVNPLIMPGSKKMGMKNSFELMQDLFVNVGKSTGATIISAAAGTQFALERGDLKNGVFTFAILEAMKNHSSLKISELKKIVGQRVEELTKGLQKPTSRNETIAVDWEVW
jgi:WD40 repeat protein